MRMTRMAMLWLGCAGAFWVRAEATENLEASAAWQKSEVDAQMLVSTHYFGSTRWPDSAQRNPVALQASRWQSNAGLSDRLPKLAASWPSIHWLGENNSDTSMASLGYTRRNLKLEGALFTGQDSDRSRNPELIQLESATQRVLRKRRLSYNFAPNLTLQVSRGYRQSPDHLGQKIVRRHVASATYRINIHGNPWHTTLAWGRGKTSAGSSPNVFLMESAMQIGRQHLIFGRLERAGNDELFRNEFASRQRSYDASKYTLGYLYDAVNSGPAKLDIGCLVSKREVPTALLPYYGNDTSYMVFMRMNVKFAAN